MPAAGPHPAYGLPRRSTIVVALLYLAVALWSVRVVLPAPASTLPQPTYLDPFWGITSRSDQCMVAWGIARAARLLPRAPWTLYDANQCYPVAKAVTFGEHMVGEGLLGVVPYLLTRDPIVTYNVVIVLTFCVGALAMYALVHYWTGSVVAAFVAGLLFGFHPARIGNPVHPFAEGNHWTPLALLFAHRLFATGRWRDALGLSLFVGLQVVESFYQALGLALIGGVYGLTLVLRNFRRLPALAPKLLVSAALAAAAAAAVFVPYLHTRDTWGVLSGRRLMLLPAATFTYGKALYPGTTLLVLAAIGLVDRLRGARTRNGEDPRLAYLMAGLVAAWAALYGVKLPWVGWVLRSPLLYVRELIPGLDAVRNPNRVALGAYVAGGLLAGYGVLALTERARPLVRAAVAIVAVAGVLVEVFVPDVAQQTFGHSVEMEPYEVRPPVELLNLYARAGNGPILDLPLDFGLGTLDQGHYVLLSAFHQHAIGSCYNSFIVPVQNDIESLAKRLPDPHALEALYALGFRTIVLHGDVRSPDVPKILRGLRGLAGLPSGGTRLVEIGEAAKHWAFRVESDVPVDATFAALTGTDGGESVATVSPPSTLVDFTFRNGDGAAYRHPVPVEPTALRVRWEDRSGGLTSESTVRVLLPLALARGEEMRRKTPLPVPARPGSYRLTVAPVTAADVVIARRDVEVVAPASATGTGDRR